MITHGTIANRDGKYRFNSKINDVEFVLWEAGEQGHKTPYWHQMGSGWKEQFTSGYPTEIQKSDRLEF